MFGNLGFHQLNPESLKNASNFTLIRLLPMNYLIVFEMDSKLNSGPRLALETKNLKSVLINPTAALQKVENEINMGRIAGPFQRRPISNLRCSPIGVVPNKTGGWRLITHLSYPPSNSVNDYIDEQHTAVHYSSFDNAVSIVKKIGKGALIGKKDIKSAFRLLPR